jgi:hypothetical protein
VATVPIDAAAPGAESAVDRLRCQHDPAQCARTEQRSSRCLDFPTVLHFFQKQTALTFYNASGQVIQGYPPVGGHVRQDDVDYVGNHSHHAKHWSVSDHLYCNVVSAPATADCFGEFATGGSLIYSDNLTVNLANSGTLAIDGGTGNYAGDSGKYSSTTIGNSNNSDVVLTLHKR